MDVQLICDHNSFMISMNKNELLCCKIRIRITRQLRKLGKMEELRDG